MKVVFLLFLVVFVCETIYRIDAAEAEDTSSVTQEADVSVDTDAKQQEIESKEVTDSPKAEEGNTKQESSTENARGDSTPKSVDKDHKKVEPEPTTPSVEKPRDDENGFGEEGTVVEANPNPPPQVPQPVDPFYRPPVIYNIPPYWPAYPGSYPSYPSYPGYEFGYPSTVGYNPWQQQRAQACPLGFTLGYDPLGRYVCQKMNIFHNLYAAAARL